MKILKFLIVIGALSLLCQSCASPPSPESGQQGNAPLVDLGNGICQQNNGLMWQVESTKTLSGGQEALDYVRDLTLGNHGDWRLPSKLELYELCQLFEMNLGGNCPIKLRGSYWATNGEIHAGEWEAYPICGGSELKYLRSKSGRVRAVRP
ncbi:MAG: DUF1566 domain-containing protein [Proteobacteria bacterium]|nr:DUF1566 domain-containing protein [Pseudomonadota bacterium]MBU1649338.1 DUF1566 domain-containing protein [Pseudomonadota bacterium]